MEANFSYSPVTDNTVADLIAIFGRSGVSVDREKIEAYSKDEVAPHLWEKKYEAEVVCFAETAEQISRLMEYANEYRIPVTPRGAGTGLSGGAVPAYKGIELSLERMNRILEFDAENLTMTVEPGVITSDINKAALDNHLMYAGDPCSGDASFIGGNVAENAGGNKVVKYGPTGSHVLGMEVVLPDGSVSWFGGKRRKDVTGYDFVHLMVGSEGTLGIVTKIILKLLPCPSFIVDLLVPFADVGSAIKAVPAVMTEGKCVPSSIEFIDKQSMVLTEEYLQTKFPFSREAGAHLILQYEGNDREHLADEIEKVGDICLKQGALEVFVADNRTTKDKLWKGRKSVAEAVWAHAPIQIANEDVVIPTSRAADFMKELENLCRDAGIKYAAYGHLGDGNMHVTLYLEREERGWREIIEAARRRLYSIVIKFGGTLTGEHGVGLKRVEYVPLFIDRAQIELIRRVKLAFDPNNILNPGKMVPWE
ncbi:FAD-binding oxidoreductase [Cloacibacillus evryensis]|uniref:FAD-binding oxidoreductase n=1 Tax=Cloacibacillus evryensis TaxID=508460 RepID=UPI0022E5DF6F|nr:FAD-linked oxidase C-terminal domain-containing protein [Cloacibacillus evryensis]